MIQNIDPVKLSALRDAHTGLHAQYQDTARRAREAQTQLAELRATNPGGSSEQKRITAQYLNLPLSELKATPPETLQAVRLDARMVQRLVTAHERAAALKEEAAAIAAKLRTSSAMVAKINAFAAGAEV